MSLEQIDCQMLNSRYEKIDDKSISNWKDTNTPFFLIGSIRRFVSDQYNRGR